MIKFLKGIGIGICFAILMLTKLASPAFSYSATEVAASARLSAVSIPKLEDKRAAKLKRFLESVNSPLTNYAADFVETADKYELDWKLLPAITGVESTFGQLIPSGSYNAYGWNNGNYFFSSWPESIEVVSKALKENYLDQGARTVEQIAPIYAPPSRTWTGRVRDYMAKIENTSFPLELTL